MSESERRYEPPALTKIGKFTKVTLGLPIGHKSDILRYWSIFG